METPTELDGILLFQHEGNILGGTHLPCKSLEARLSASDSLFHLLQTPNAFQGSREQH